MHDYREEVRSVDHILAAIQAAFRRRAAARAGLWVGSAALAVLAGLLAADAAADFGAARPAVYFIALVAAAAGVVGAAWTGWMRRPSPLYLAHLVERRRPELKSALVTYVELRCTGGGDPSMCAAVGRRAGQVLKEADPAEFVPPGSLRPAGAAATASACVLALALWLTQGIIFRGGPAAAVASPDAAGRPGVIARSAVPAGPSADGASSRAAGPSAALAEEAARELVTAIQADGGKFERLAAALAEQSPGPPAGTGGQGAGESGPTSAAAGNAGQGAAENTDGPGGSSAASAAQSDSAQGPNGDARPADAQGPRSADGPANGGGSGNAGAKADSGKGGNRPPDSPDAATGGAAPRGSPAGALPDSTGRAEAGMGEGGAAPAPRPGHATPPPLLPRPQPTDFPEKTLDAMRRVKRLIDGADERLREGEVTDGFLGRMGMSNADFRRFVSAWQRKLEQVAPESSGAPLPVRQAGRTPPKGELIGGGTGPDSRPIVGPAPSADAAHGPVQAAGSQISARLRPAVAAYFEAVGKLAAESGAEDVPK